MTIKERAIKYADGYRPIESYKEVIGRQRGYIYGATEQKQIDIEKLKDIMNCLMLDTKDKAEIIKAMEEYI